MDLDLVSVPAAVLEEGFDGRHVGEMMAVFDWKFGELEGADLRDAARALVEAAVRAHAVAPELHRVFVEQVPRVGDLGAVGEVGEVESRIEEGLRRYLEGREEQLAPGDPILAAFVVFRAVESATHAAVLERPGYLRDGRLAEEFTALVLRYLLPQSTLGHG